MSGIMNYFIYGTSYRLIDAEIDKILNGKRATVYSLEEVGIDEVLEDLGYDEMFAEEKVIVLKDFESVSITKNEKAIERLINYLKEPNSSTTLIFTSREKLAARGTTKTIASLLKVIETPIISKPYELAKLMENVIRSDGYTMPKNALDMFVANSNSNYDIAVNEFEKLKKIKGNSKNITLEDVLKYTSNYNMTDSFGLKDAIINRDIAKASAMIDDLETAKMEVIGIVIMLAKEYQAIYNIKLLAKTYKMNDAIGKEMGGMHPFRVKILRDVSLKYTEEELERSILYLCNLNVKLVSEDNLGFDELRKFLLQL